jgi:hypothetical protein
VQCSASLSCYPVAAMTDDSMVVLQNCSDLEKDVSGSHSEACPSSSHSTDQAFSIKVEELSDVEDGGDPVPVSFVGTRAERKVSCTLPGTSSHSQPELFTLFLNCICYNKNSSLW